MATREEKIAFLQSQSAPSQESRTKTREEKIAFLQGQKPQEKQEESEPFNFGPGLAKGAEYALDLPAAPIRGLLGKLTGTKKSGFLPDSAPSSKEIIDSAFPSLKEHKSNMVDTDISYLPENLRTKETQDYVNNLASKNEHDISEPAAGALDMATGMIGYGALDKGLKGISSLGKGLKNTGKKLVINSTGATGKEAAKFSDDAAQELFDRKLVRFGDSPADVAKRTESAMNEATSQIDESLKGLDAKGVKISADKVVENLQAKIATLKKDPSQSGVVRKLQGIIDDIIESGNSQVPITEGEATKRGFNKAAGNWMDPEAGQAGKQAYLSYRDEVESAGRAADPLLAHKFEEGKKTYGLLAPIQEAAERRSLVQKQSPFGGLGDFAATGAGGAVAGGPGAIAGLIAKKVIAPRVTSSLAVTSDKIAQALLKIPKFEEMAGANPAAFQSVVNSISKEAESTPQLSGLLNKVSEKKEPDLKRSSLNK